jgi:hypothetical protein
VVPKKKRTLRDAEKRRVDYEARRRRLERQRNVIGFLGIVPLVFSVGCGTGTPFDMLCFLPRDVWMFVWAALLGSFIGLTIRLILERRRFQKVERGAA